MIDLNKFSNEEVVNKIKALKRNKIIDALLVGFTIGISVYAVFIHGWTIQALIPLVVAYLVVRNTKNNNLLAQELTNELDKRGIK